MVDQRVRRGMVPEQQRNIDPFSKVEQLFVGPVNQLVRIGIADLTKEQARGDEQP